MFFTSFDSVTLVRLPNKLNENILYLIVPIPNMPFTDKQMFDAIEANADVKICFERISFACKELKSKTGCPNDDVDRFLEFAIGKWADSYSKH